MIREYEKGKAVKVGEHFWSTEFDCHCVNKNCIVTYIDDDLVQMLDRKRNVWRKPIDIRSGFRCVAWNRHVGGKEKRKGKPGSCHLTGKAADIVVEGMTPQQVQYGCVDFDGLGCYKDFTHVDVRGYKARWKG